MDIAQKLSEIKIDLSAGACVTIGNFDGVHKGHQKLLSRVVGMAKARNMKSVAVTFCPHPLRVLVGPHTPPFITIREQKLDLFEGMGVDLTLVINFNREVAALDPEEFVKEYLVDWLNTKELVVGYDYSFGKGRKGNYEMLSKLGEKYGFRCERIEPVILNDAIVSSTRIRDMLKAGDVWGVKPLLGRFYVVRGWVVRGKDRGGRQLGFPTANLKLDSELLPQGGVYAVWIMVNDKIFPGVANIGYCPTFGNEEISLEVHIMDFDEDIYGYATRVYFVQRLRSEKKFNGLDELVSQINQDVDLARQILAAPESKLQVARFQDAQLQAAKLQDETL